MHKIFEKYLKFSLLAVSFLFLSCCSPFCSQKSMEQKISVEIPEHRARLLLSDEAKPTQQLLDLLHLFELEHDHSLQSIVEVTQKNLLRQAGKERWQTAESVYEAKKSEIIPQLDSLGLFQEICATKTHYRYALLLGATASTVRKRLAFLIDEWKRGVRCDAVVILAGERPLDPELESAVILYDRSNHLLPIKKDWKEPAQAPQTETEMMKMIFDQADFPEDFSKITCIIVDASMKKNADGSLRRPTTGDTVDAWLATNPIPGDCLVVSSQPYVTYQDSVMRTLMPTTFSLETIGSKASKEEPLSTLLDSVARILYQEQQCFKKVSPELF